MSDQGHITDPLAGRRLPQAGDEHGRGLLLAGVLSDLLQILLDRSGTTVRIYKRIT